MMYYQNVRGYRCKVPGCNKCFQRGEHLKRHVRSIHTNEKRAYLSLLRLSHVLTSSSICSAHKCPHKNCGKDFSRHDNLRQHMRVHRNEPPDTSEGTAASS